MSLARSVTWKVLQLGIIFLCCIDLMVSTWEQRHSLGVIMCWSFAFGVSNNHLFASLAHHFLFLFLSSHYLFYLLQSFKFTQRCSICIFFLGMFYLVPSISESSVLGRSFCFFGGTENNKWAKHAKVCHRFLVTWPQWERKSTDCVKNQISIILGLFLTLSESICHLLRVLWDKWSFRNKIPKRSTVPVQILSMTNDYLSTMELIFITFVCAWSSFNYVQFNKNHAVAS